ncbi:unnamed protein product [Alternaria alternata]
MPKTLFNSEPWTPSFWTQKEKDSFEENIERFGTDWTAFANVMGTKTPEMVERFYDQLSAKAADSRNEDARTIRNPRGTLTIGQEVIL